MLKRKQIDGAMSHFNAVAPASFTDREALEALLVTVDAHIKLTKNYEVSQLLAQIRSKDNEELKCLAEAMGQTWLGRDPKIAKDLGYLIADISHRVGGRKWEQITKDKEELKLLNKVLGYLDIDDFVFNNTHYDECSNGFFFRRS
jgi:hypothetical protein